MREEKEEEWITEAQLCLSSSREGGEKPGQDRTGPGRQSLKMLQRYESGDAAGRKNGWKFFFVFFFLPWMKSPRNICTEWLSARLLANQMTSSPGKKKKTRGDCWQWVEDRGCVF